MERMQKVRIRMISTQIAPSPTWVSFALCKVEGLEQQWTWRCLLSAIHLLTVSQLALSYPLSKGGGNKWCKLMQGLFNVLYETRVLFIDISWMGIHLGRGNKTVPMSSLSKWEFPGNEDSLARAMESQTSKDGQHWLAHALLVLVFVWK